MDITELLKQLPNFAGLLICVAYLWRMSDQQAKMISHLIDVIVKKENCEDEEKSP